MAKAKKLEDITIEEPQESTAPVRNLLIPETVCKHSPDVNIRERIKQQGSGHHGISPKSPVIYVSPEIKRLLKLLKAQIIINDGESIPESAIVSKALKEYCDKNQTEFYINNKTLFDSL